MCGFVGEVRWENINKVSPTLLKAARDCMSARGPDAEGIWLNASASVGLAHRRLSILDLDPRSNQPFSDISGRFHLVYNGEVYNFHVIRKKLEALGTIFRTESDTEVVLYALIKWGVKAFDEFSGMFALAFWDEQEHQLILARDRIGVKPLYIDTRGNKRIAFASTLAPLLKLAPVENRLNLPALSTYLRMLYVPASECAVEGIIKLPAGSYLKLDRAGSAQQAQWWNPFKTFTTPQPYQQINVISPQAAVNEVDRLLGEAVRSRLVSDVPVGVLLSGGIDSSLVTAHMMAAKGSAVDSFTIAFDSSEHDESKVAEQVAQHLGTRHHVLTATASGLTDFIEDFPLHFDEPFADVSAFPTMLVSQLTRKQVTVALCGDGGDELFGGYNYYAWLKKYERVFQLPAWLRKTAASISPLLNSLNSTSAMAVAALGCADMPAVFAYMRSASKAVDWEKLCKFPGGEADAFFRAAMAKRSLADVRQQAMAADLTLYLPDDILVKGDRASMAASLETRHPFLDVKLVEFALSLPPAILFAQPQSKWLLREILKKYVPESIVNRPKHGFNVPIRDWFRGPLKDFVRDHLSLSRMKDDPLVHGAAVEHLVNEHIAGTRNHENLIWAILAYRLWRERFGVH
ncbi:MAG: asparagine synthase (glutamine-hydrolyzing) [Pseudomonadota bacterium]